MKERHIKYCRHIRHHEMYIYITFGVHLYETFQGNGIRRMFLEAWCRKRQGHAFGDEKLSVRFFHFPHTNTVHHPGEARGQSEERARKGRKVSDHQSRTVTVPQSTTWSTLGRR